MIPIYIFSYYPGLGYQTIHVDSILKAFWRHRGPKFRQPPGDGGLQHFAVSDPLRATPFRTFVNITKDHFRVKSTSFSYDLGDRLGYVWEHALWDVFEWVWEDFRKKHQGFRTTTQFSKTNMRYLSCTRALKISMLGLFPDQHTKHLKTCCLIMLGYSTIEG